MISQLRTPNGGYGYGGGGGSRHTHGRNRSPTSAWRKGEEVRSRGLRVPATTSQIGDGGDGARRSMLVLEWTPTSVTQQL